MKRVICEGCGFWRNQERWEEQGREGEGAPPGAIKVSGRMAVSNPDRNSGVSCGWGLCCPRRGAGLSQAPMVMSTPGMLALRGQSSSTGLMVILWRRVLGVCRGRWRAPKLGRDRAGIDLFWVSTASTPGSEGDGNQPDKAMLEAGGRVRAFEAEISPVRVLEAEGDLSNPRTGSWMKNRHRWRWSVVDNACEASAQVRHRVLASVIPALVCAWWWGAKSEETSHWLGSERDQWKQETAQVDMEPSAYRTAAPTKAVAAGTPATGGPLKDSDPMLTAWIRGFCTLRNKGRNQIRQNLSGHVVYHAEIHITNIWPPKWQVFWTTGKGNCCCQWACVTGRNFHCLIVTGTLWSRFTYEITEPWRTEVTFQRSEVIVSIRPINISRTHGVSPSVIFKHPDKERKKKVQH